MGVRLVAGMRIPRSHNPGMADTHKKRGRKPDASSKSSQVRALLATGMGVADIAKKVGCTPNLVYVIKAKSKAKRGPGRPAKAAAGAKTSLDGLAGIVDMVKNTDRERAQLRGALEKIRDVIAAALA